QVQGQEVEEESAVVLRRQGHHLAAAIGRQGPVDPLQVRGLAGAGRAVIHDLAEDLPGRVLHQRHQGSSGSGRIRWRLDSRSRSNDSASPSRSVSWSSGISRMASTSRSKKSWTRPSVEVSSKMVTRDRKSTRLNSSHVKTSY